MTWEHVLGLFASPEVKTSGRTVTWFFSTLSCLTLSSAARERGQGAHHRALSLCHPGAERVYKRRNTDGSSVSVVTSSTAESPACLPLLSRWSGRIEDMKTDTRGGASHGGMELLSMRSRHYKSMKPLTEFNVRILQDKTFLVLGDCILVR